MILNNIDNLIIESTLLTENKYKILYDLGKDVIGDFAKDSLENLDGHPISQYLNSKIGIGFKELSVVLSLAGLAFTIGKITYNHFTSIKYKILRLKKLKQQLKKDKNNIELQKEIQELEEFLEQEKIKLQSATKNYK